MNLQTQAGGEGSARPDSLKIEDFDIVELEDRLELGDRCNNNCGCQPPSDP